MDDRFQNLGYRRIIDLSNGKEYPLVFLREELGMTKSNGGMYFYSANLLGNTLKFITEAYGLIFDGNIVVALDYDDPVCKNVGGLIQPRVIAAADGLSAGTPVYACNDVSYD